MAKLNKQCYYTANKEKKVNCYHVHISKDIVNKASFDEDDEIVIYNKNETIVIAKKWHCICMECGTEWNTGKDYGMYILCPRCQCGDVSFRENCGPDDY